MSYLARRLGLSEMRVASQLFVAGFHKEAGFHYEIAGGLFEDAGMPNSSAGCYLNADQCRKLAR